MPISPWGLIMVSIPILYPYPWEYPWELPYPLQYYLSDVKWYFRRVGDRRAVPVGSEGDARWAFHSACWGAVPEDDSLHPDADHHWFSTDATTFVTDRSSIHNISKSADNGRLLLLRYVGSLKLALSHHLRTLSNLEDFFNVCLFIFSSFANFPL